MWWSCLSHVMSPSPYVHGWLQRWNTAYVFYVIKPIRHFLTSAAHRVAPCLCWISLFVLISITVGWLLASVHHRERRVSYRGRPGREAFPRQCRSSTDFLWFWRMLMTTDLRGGGKWSISGVLIQPSCCLSWPNDHCRDLEEEAIYASG